MAATLGVVLAGKPLAALAIVLLLRHPLRAALCVAAVLAQIGEFSFLLARLGRRLDVLPQAASDTLVVAAIVSIALNPLLLRLVEPAHAWIARRPRWLARLERGQAAPPSARSRPPMARPRCARWSSGTVRSAAR